MSDEYSGDADNVDHSGETLDTRSARAASRDEALLELLAEGFTHSEAAEFAGCSVKTIQRRLLDDKFARELARRRAIRLDDVTGRLARITTKAVTALEDTLEISNPTLRFRAAQTVVGLALRLRDEHETERRLHRLEQQANQQTTEEDFPSWDQSART